jgi:hypothetical protein
VTPDLHLRRSFLLLALLMLTFPVSAGALIEPPATVDGPNADVRAFGGVALASDGTGGAVYTKLDGGVEHVYVSRRLHGTWSYPIRVDFQPYDAAEPRIAASAHGRLLVVWVSPIATVHGKIQRALSSSELPAGGENFSPPLLVDPNVGDGSEVDPSLAGTGAGAAIVAYRVVTNDFGPSQTVTGAVRLRPGDVLADIRLARLGGGRWSRIGAVNRNAGTSMPGPTAANAPQVGVSATGGAVVGWIERDQGATARVYARRIFGTSPGPILPAGPTVLDGRPITDDADALALDVSPLGMAQVITRVTGVAGGALGGTRVFANQLPVSLDPHGGTFLGAVAVDGGSASSATGRPSVAVADGVAGGGARVAFATAAGPHLEALGSATKPAPGPLMAPLTSTADTVVGLAPARGDATSGSLTGWPVVGADGLPAVALRQEYAAGGAQTGVVAGTEAGDVSQLAIGDDDAGDDLVGFLQGALGRFEVVVTTVTAPPARFSVTAPADWVRPRSVRLSWQQSPSATLHVTYSVLLDGDPIARGLTGRSLRPAAALLGSGRRRVQVLGTDLLGQTVLSDPVTLKVDGRAPTAKVAHDRKAARKKRPRAYVVTVADASSGVVAGRTTCTFGDGSKRVAGHRTFRHVYRRPGRYVVRVVTRDRVGNATTVRLRVQAR